jgi:hypothetical protein
LTLWLIRVPDHPRLSCEWCHPLPLDQALEGCGWLNEHHYVGIQIEVTRVGLRRSQDGIKQQVHQLQNQPTELRTKNAADLRVDKARSELLAREVGYLFMVLEWISGAWQYCTVYSSDVAKYLQVRI